MKKREVKAKKLTSKRKIKEREIKNELLICNARKQRTIEKRNKLAQKLNSGSLLIFHFLRETCFHFLLQINS